MKEEYCDGVDKVLEECRTDKTPMEKLKKYDIEELLNGVDEFPEDYLVDFGSPVGREV